MIFKRNKEVFQSQVKDIFKQSISQKQNNLSNLFISKTQQLQAEEERLLAELSEVEAEQKAAREVLEKHEEEKARLEDEEERYWREYCTHKSQLTAMEDENRRCVEVSWGEKKCLMMVAQVMILLYLWNQIMMNDKIIRSVVQQDLLIQLLDNLLCNPINFRDEDNFNCSLLV